MTSRSELEGFEARAQVRHDVRADVAAQPLVGVAVRGHLGDDQLDRLVGELVQSLLQRLAERDDRRLRDSRHEVSPRRRL